MNWMIYGANGYSGQLIAREAVERGERPILAGRSESVKALAQSLGLESRVFAVESLKTDPNARALDGINWILNCAGPFARTYKSVLEACLRKKVHYLDITGEVSVFEAVHARDAEAKAAGILLLPGVGADVVPTDCLAAQLKDLLPGATTLKIALMAEGRLSPGTTATVLLGVQEGSFVREGGKLISTPFGAREWVVEFDDKPVTVRSIPWGDLATAYYTTGIPNIATYTPLARSAALGSRGLAYLLRHPRIGPKLRPRIEQAIKRWVPGSSEEERETEYTLYVAEVSDSEGKVRRLRMVTPNGYTLTARSSVEAILRLRALAPHPTGFRTPSQVFGSGFAETLKDVRVEEPSLPPDTENP